MSKIDDELPTEVLVALADALGFRQQRDTREGVDEWTLSSGHGVTHRQFTGTRKAVCAFLYGYAEMQLRTTEMLNDMDNTHRRLVGDMRVRLGC